MVSWDVIVGGTSLDAVQAVDTTSESGGTLGTARVVVANTDANRSIDYSQDARIEKNGSLEYEGPITKKPSIGSASGQIEFTAADKRYELSLIEAHRPFYQKDPGEIIRSTVNEKATIKSDTTIHEGSDASPWSATSPNAGLVGATEQRLQEMGTDVYAIGIPNGATGVYEATYAGVPSAAIPGDGQVVRLSTRLMANNQADVFEGEIDLRDNAGNNFIWQFGRLDTNFRDYEFSGQDAVTESYVAPGSESTQNGTLTYRFKAKGSMPENRAIAIDYATALPYTVQSRNASVSTSGVENVGTTINRRHDESVMAVIGAYATEYGYTSWVDEYDVLHFEPAGGQNAPRSIDQSTTPVVDTEFDRDSDRIKNKVTVQGDGGVQVTAVDSSSVQFYGLSVREDQIVDNSIQTEAEARKRAEGFLEDKAWSDVAFSFTIADSAYSNVRVGQAISISWPPENITASTWTISSVDVEQGGLVTIGVTGASD
jgi:hypothetical protein